ncbi:hypothetical protein Tco_0155214 [Tanacetum coccineum]
MGVFIICRCWPKMVNLYNRPVERSGDGKPSVGSNSQSVSINENVFQSFNSYAKAVLGNKSVDMSGKYEQVMLSRNLWGVDFKDLSDISRASKHIPSEDFDEGGLRYVGDVGFVEFRLYGSSERVKTFKDVFDNLVGLLPLATWLQSYKKLVSVEQRVYGYEVLYISYRNRTYRIIATEFAYWAPNIESMEVNSESNPLERKDAEGLSLDESLENEEHLDVDSCDSDSPKNVNNDSCRLLVGFAREVFVG